MVDECVGEGLDGLSTSLLDDGAASAAPNAPPDMRSLVISLATLVFSIPALVGS